MMRISWALAILTIIAVLSSPYLRRSGAAEDALQVHEEESALADNDKAAQDPATGRFNLAFKTAGGAQLWTDHAYRNGYRIQQHSVTSHWRLLDSNDIRRAWGTRAQCDAMLDHLAPPPEDHSPASSHVMVLLHGLMRTHHSMKPLEATLNQNGFPDVIRFSYASTRSSIGGHAAALRELLEGQPPKTRFSFVGHSMGNIVVRHLVGDLQADGDPRGLLPRCQSMVMLGPPNQGAAIARRLAPTGLYGLLTGRGGMELGPEWDQFVERLATPPFPFTIIAGDLSENRIQNPLVDGSGDFVVAVKEAQLEGAESLETIPAVHSFLMTDEAAQKLTIDFLKKSAGD